MWQAIYIDRRSVKRFLSSKGADLTFDNQSAGLVMGMSFKDGERSLDEGWDLGRNRFADLQRRQPDFKARLQACEDFLARATPVKPGKYTVILSPLAAGVFAHESFGHKSEADLMIGDKTMMKEWTIGKRVGSPLLSIVDTGLLDGSGRVPFDDEGTRATRSYLIKKGILAGRLHSLKTATLLKEEPTGNARAVSFQFEPIVRMTTTYIEPGGKTKAELIAEVKDGLLVETIKHGSGMSTFTLAPSLAYRIKDGKVAEPVQISVVSGSVFETLGLVDGLSDKLELLSFVKGGCGKMDQHPLPVGFGGPYVRVKSLNVQ